MSYAAIDSPAVTLVDRLKLEQRSEGLLPRLPPLPPYLPTPYPTTVVHVPRLARAIYCFATMFGLQCSVSDCVLDVEFTRVGLCLNIFVLTGLALTNFHQTHPNPNLTILLKLHKQVLKQNKTKPKKTSFEFYLTVTAAALQVANAV